MIWFDHTKARDSLLKTTLNLDDQVLKNAKERAARDGITLTAFVDQALKASLLRDSEKKPIVLGQPS